MKYFIYAGFIGLLAGWLLFGVSYISNYIIRDKNRKVIFRNCVGGFVCGFALLVVANLCFTGAAYQKYQEVIELKTEQFKSLDEIRKGQEELKELLLQAKNSADVLNEVLPEWSNELKNNATEKKE